MLGDLRLDRGLAAVAGVLLVALPLAGSAAELEPERAAPTAPPACTAVGPGASLQAALDAAPEGGAVCLAPGDYPGRLQLERGLTLWGPPDAVIRSAGVGTTIRIVGPVRLLGFTVDGSGGRFDTLDAAIHVAGSGAVLEGLLVRNAVFGILVEKADHVTIRGNRVTGQGGTAIGLRGDSIRLWETKESVVQDNLVEAGRDMVIWYSTGNRVEGNLVRGSRYGTHLMYAHRTVIRNNRYLGDVVGVFIMYSRDVELRDNLIADASGSAGMGLGVKESGNLVVTDNRFLRNTTGIYLDQSPLQLGEHNLFERNELRLGQVAVLFHSSEHRNVFRENLFRDNQLPVQVDGGGDALGVTWVGNDFDDYAGYDFDGDGIGDVPFELRSATSDLASRYPELDFFRGAPVLALVNAASELFPLWQPKTVLRDESPRLAPFAWEAGLAP